MATFLQWFYGKKKPRLGPSERGKILKPGAEGMDVTYGRRKRKKKKRTKNSLLYKPSSLDEDEALLELIDEIYTNRGRRKKRSHSYPPHYLPSLDDFQQRQKDPRLKRRYRSAEDYHRHKRYRSKHQYDPHKPQLYEQVDRQVNPTTPDEILRISTYIDADNVRLEQDLGWP